MDFSAIDWQRPWLAHLNELGRQLSQSADWVHTANQMARERELKNSANLPIMFVPQDVLPEATAYEAHIDATAQVPTRDNLHDFFNALIWLQFPKIKRTLNQLQAQEIRRSPESMLRGRQRDAATLFDENVALFVSRDTSTLNLLKGHQWKALLFDEAIHFHRNGKVILFGHALIEKLVHPYKSITAHVWCVPAAKEIIDLPRTQFLPWLDESVAAAIISGFSSKAFCHLPVLGVPGWWEGQDELFYADEAVFRPSRSVKSNTENA